MTFPKIVSVFVIQSDEEVRLVRMGTVNSHDDSYSLKPSIHLSICRLIMIYDASNYVYLLRLFRELFKKIQYVLWMIVIMMMMMMMMMMIQMMMMMMIQMMM